MIHENHELGYHILYSTHSTYMNDIYIIHYGTIIIIQSNLYNG